MKTPTFFLLILLTILILFNSVIAQSFKTERVKYHFQDLRVLSSSYFNNPNYWEAILKFSNVESLAELQKDDVLIIPVGLISATVEKTEETLSAINAATENGAKVFTPELLENARVKLDKSIELKGANNWNESYKVAGEALNFAKQALEQSQLLRRQSADATISFRKGEVQNRTPSQRLWKEAALFSKLYEEDRARTLRDSYAEITFIDLSRVRLNENSQALIQRSKLDLLKNTTETKVKLIKGDAFAYLQKSPKKKFDLDIPGLDTRIMSKSFWVEKEDVSTKIANYEGEIELNARGKTVMVKENQGSVIPTGGSPSDPKDLLPSPILTLPENKSQFYTGSIIFSWEVVNDSKKYWFEIAQDQSFKNLVYSTKSLTSNNTKMKSLSPGVYYWRVASIDEFGFPGKFGDSFYIHVIKDENEPYLYLTSPAQQVISTDLNITVSGETEKSCRVSVNHISVPVNDDGRFSQDIQLSEGYNQISVICTDKAGNVSRYTSNVVCETNANVNAEIISSNYDAKSGTITHNDNLVSIKGVTRALSSIDVTMLGSDIMYKAFADTTGLFQYSINSTKTNEKLIQNILSPAGFTRTDTLNIVIDKIKPEIILDSRIPKLTSQASLSIAGKVSDAEKVFINEKLVNTHFNETINLTEDKNIIVIRATDKAGNVATHENVVVLDVTPPELIKHNISKVQGKSSLYNISVAAKDPAGLKKAITVRISSGDNFFDEILKLNDESDIYEGTVNISESASVKIYSIVLEDYLNNSKTYLIK